MTRLYPQEDDHWQAIQQEKNSVKRRLHFVQMAKLLLERAKTTEQEQKNLDEDDLTDLQLEYKKIGRQTQDFLNTSLPFIDPEFKGQPFEIQIQALRDTLQASTQRLTTVHKQNAKLLAEKELLQQRAEALEELETKVASLEKLQERLRPEVIQKIQHQIWNPVFEEGLARALETLHIWTEKAEEVQQNIHAHFVANQEVTKLASLHPNTTDIAKKLGKLANEAQHTLALFDETLAQLIATEEQNLKIRREQQTPGVAEPS